ncbi:MAG: glycoside hydrolase family 2 protein [Clostridia bacterium]|nr:glycoside hydrolase family 2 protein [Clostridia bacterium]
MRNILNFNADWMFTKQADTIPAALPSDWEQLSLPHSWNAIDGQDGDNDYYRGKGYYAKTIKKADLPEAEQYYLEIRGANSSADVYLNGEQLAHHDGGYSTWRVNLTDALTDENLLVIVVDNSANETVYPQMADFTFYGGLYRDVNLVCVAASHFDLDYYGGPGLMVTPEICNKDAKVEIECFVTNKTDAQQLHYVIEDKDGKVVAETSTADTKVTLDIKDVTLWHGRKNPYLYTAKIELIQNGKVVDNVSTRFGCRTFKIDPDNGFILNGEEYPLRGVSRHQDRWQKGNALSKEDHKEDIELIYEVGATTIRLAHYQHDQYFYDLCDEYGLVIWAEIPYISKHMPTGRENTVFQMKELITQNYNHASIVVWGLSNEIGIGGSDEDLLENHRILNDMCHEMDKTRLTTIAAVSMCKIDDPYLQIPDVVSYNHYFGWYGGETDMNGPWFDKFHATHPNIPIGCSEYGCEALNWHTSDPMQGDYTEEYQAYYHEELIKQFFTRKYMWATHVWNMFDFGADARNEGGENGQNHKGLVTIDRKYKKDAFYAYKAWLSDEPFVHLCGKRYVDRVEDITKVTVYSNQPEVELFANGVSLGKQTSDVHFFYFDVPNKDTTNLVAVAGDCKDESTIRKVDTFNEDYRMKEEGGVINWFEIDTPVGYLSINDTLGDILKPFKGKIVLLKTLLKLKNAMGGGDSDKPKEKKKGGKPKVMGFEVAGFKLNSTIIDMAKGFTVKRILMMIGAKMSKEDILEINKALNKIKKK